MINGSPTSFFRSSRDLRYGDPLSPHLFIMVNELLGKMILKAEVGSRIVSISHMQLADDTMIFFF